MVVWLYFAQLCFGLQVLAQTQAWDYIVVGVGYGGLISADRLSEAGKTVLLIERGAPSYAETGGTYKPAWATNTNYTKFDVPGLFETMWSDANSFWWCTDVAVSAGCVVGGGSAVNGGIYWYPMNDDFSTANGWPSSWADHTPYTAKLKARIPGTDHPSTDGKRYLDQPNDVVAQGLAKAGYQNATLNENPNAKDKVFGHTSYSFINGTRGGPIMTYLRSAKARANFKLITNTAVTNVVRDGPQITGVQTDTTTYSLAPNGRVILSAGAFGTARILFRSGIGPADMIKLVQANSAAAARLPPASRFITLPVGQNISDHTGINMVFTHPSLDAYDDYTKVCASLCQADVDQYFKDRSGPLAFASARAHHWRAYTGTDGKKRYVQSTTKVGASVFGGGANASQAFLTTLYLTHGTTSRGRIGIDANLRAVTISRPWFTDAADKAVMVTAATEYLSAMKQVPNITVVTPGSSQSISDYGTVVDASTKVLNTNNLFVVDAGVIPRLPVGNPQGVIMSMAEQAVAKILASVASP